MRLDVEFPKSLQFMAWRRIRVNADVRLTEQICWLWNGAKNWAGYGRLKFERSYFLAHRLAYAATKGVVPKGMRVLHRCDTPACVNPDHLFLGSQADNVRDMCSKGRHWGTSRKIPPPTRALAYAVRTHCNYGHAFSGSNLRIRVQRNGYKRRVCRECHRLASIRRRRALKLVLKDPVRLVRRPCT